MNQNVGNTYGVTIPIDIDEKIRENVGDFTKIHHGMMYKYLEANVDYETGPAYRERSVFKKPGYK